MSKPFLTRISTPQLALFAVVGICVYALVRIAILLITPESVWLPLPAAGSAASSAAGGPLQPYDFAVDPFSREVSAAPLADTQDAPQTNLSLRLLGLRAVDGQPSGGSAVLETPDKRQRGFAVGDKILSGVTLEAVYANYVLLSQNGKRERLDFKDRGQSALAQSAQRPAQQLQTAAASPPLAMEAVDMKALLTQVTLRKAASGGYTVTSLKPGADISRFGLAFGDRIIAIDGRDLTGDTVDPARILSQLSPQSRPVLTIVRGDEKKTIKIGTP